MVNFINIFS